SRPPESEAWAAPGDLVRVYRYDVMPRGLISRLMVRLHRHVREPDLAWSSGVFFETDTATLLAQQRETPTFEVELRARGADPSALLATVADELDALNRTFPGLEGRVEKLIPCTCELCAASTTPELFEQRRLVQRKK